MTFFNLEEKDKTKYVNFLVFMLMDSFVLYKLSCLEIYIFLCKILLNISMSHMVFLALDA